MSPIARTSHANAKRNEQTRHAKSQGSSSHRPVLYLATAKQIALIHKLRDELQMTGYTNDNITRNEASQRITYLLGVQRRRATHGGA